MKKDEPHPLLTIPTSVGCFFLDSGAHSIYSREVIAANHRNGYAFYETDEFRAYVDNYAAFIKRFGWAIDYYANVDAIFHPELTYKTQRYMEQHHGLKPVPVVHFGTPLKWLQKYLDDGHEFIGLGGLGQEVTKDEYYAWADKVFSLLCPASNGRKPIARTHGFAMTSWELMRRYPWWSVDSASWIKAASYGMIYVPRKLNGEYSMEVRPYSISVSNKSPSMKDRGKHVLSLSAGERKVVEEWLERIEVPLGKFDPKTGDEIDRGALTHHKPRARANLLYFQMLSDSLPKYPWAFRVDARQGFFNQF